MQITLRVFLAFFLIVGLSAFFIQRVFIQEVKPAVRQVVEENLVDTANLLAELAAKDMRNQTIATGNFAQSVKNFSHRKVNALIWDFRKTTLHHQIRVCDNKGLVVFDSENKELGKNHSQWNDVRRTLQGAYGARSTRAIPGDANSTVMHVAAPIMDGNQIIGVLTVANPNRTLAPTIERAEKRMLNYGLLLLALSLAVGLSVTLWLSRSLNALRRFATAVIAGKKATPPTKGAKEIVQLGQVLKSMREQLEGKQYVENYVHQLAHEIKSPLSAIGASVELLEENLSESDKKRFLSTIASQSKRLSTLVEKMLKLAALEHQQHLDNTQLVQPLSLANRVMENLAPSCATHHVQIQVHAEPNLPLIQAEPLLLEQAIFNLAENAVQFSPPNGLVSIRLSVFENTLEISIEDQGEGIAEFAQARLFERFFSLPRPQSGNKSTGLGLCFVREVALLHRGNLQLANRPQGGCLAKLQLPFAHSP
ncbi:MAG: two-component system sensor histidine kinase CreC [Proteobacteria bacterium]|nr:two-component system sensor histidine kinase CreC [Cystobacterineae bacterium]MCL2258472.1 two-component system sensor histidine kinase CreC [Cystobacterineae bacterium]MCL2315188.1 two-component system sensor histidine kinase CreC [Pseudomonadota bacterium]